MFAGTKVKSVNTMNLDGKNKETWNDIRKDSKDKESDRAADRGQRRYRDFRGSVGT